jgi:hypothetical protein
MNFVKLSDQISEYFNAEELADLCFRLGLQYDNLAGGTVSAKARELTDYCRRHGRMEKLVAACRQLRPHVLWATPEPAADAPTSQPDFGGPPTGVGSANIPATMPGGFQPPQAPGMFWMPYPNTWYGPFYGFFIGWMVVGGFQVWNPMMSPMMGPVVYPDPFRQLQRNMWVRLFNSPFNIFVDGGPNGYVFAQYSPI